MLGVAAESYGLTAPESAISAVLENGIPDEAYTALSGDDKTVASVLKKQNKADRPPTRANRVHFALDQR